MKKTLYIHIGTHKTGSTAIQNFLALNRPELQRHGVLYPGTTLNHYYVAAEISAAEQPFSNNKTELFRVFSEIRDNLNDVGKCIISAENFYGNCETACPNIRKILDFFQIDVQVKIIIFFRPQVSLIESFYQQLVKSIIDRSTLTFSQYLQNPYAFCDYYQQANLWAACFGKENIIIRRYDPSQTRTKIYEDFLSAVNLSGQFEWEIPPALEMNKGLQNDTVEFLRWLNILRIDGQVFRRVVDLLQKVDSAGQKSCNFIGMQEAARLKRLYEGSNRMVAIEYLNSPDGILFPGELTSELGSETVFTQSGDFCPGEFKHQIEFIKEQDDLLLYALYTEAYKLISGDLITYQAKHSLLSFLKRYLDADKINWLNRIYPVTNLEDEFMLMKTEGWNIELRITETNFSDSTFDFSKDCTGGIKIKNHKVLLESSGIDPFFSIRRCTGNFDSETFVSIVMEASTETAAQLFYQTRTQHGFTGNASLTKNVSKGLNTVCFIVDDPGFNGQMRIDPGNVPGEYLIHEIVIKSNARSYLELFSEKTKLTESIFPHFTK